MVFVGMLHGYRSGTIIRNRSDMFGRACDVSEVPCLPLQLYHRHKSQDSGSDDTAIALAALYAVVLERQHVVRLVLRLLLLWCLTTRTVRDFAFHTRHDTTDNRRCGLIPAGTNVGSFFARGPLCRRF